ncbi:MAG: hypothetical protein FJ128_13835 [Deltaproteobacteria bacterium]|nr:hypothetical protein [Deltaproteobacteria bacterium]
MSRERNRANRGVKLEIKVIPPQYLDLPLAEIARLMGDGPLLWPGGAGRSQGVKFVHYDIKKKRGRKPKKALEAGSAGASAAAGKTSRG